MKTGSVLWKGLAVLVALAGALALAVRLLTWYGVYDDEGLMLESIAHYVTQGHLYTQTFSQYGPFYFYAQGIFFQLLHLPVTHDMGRLVTLVYWVASSLLAAVFVFRSSLSIFLASAAGLCVMLAGLVLTNEPGHPQQLLLLLFMLAACLSQLPVSGPYSLRLFLLGCVGAALLFTKVNVGVFFLAGLAQALVCVLPSGRIRWIGIGLTMIYAAAAPWLLMHGGFNRGFLGYCILATVSAIVTLTLGAFAADSWRPSAPFALYSAAGLLGGILLTIIATSLQGMSLSSLLWGVIVSPLRHPKVFDIPLEIQGLHLWAAVSLAAGVVVLRLWGNRLPDARWLDALRCAAGITAIFLLTLPESAAPLPGDPLRVLVDSLTHRIQWVVPLLPLALIPQPQWKRDAASLFPRLFVTFMAVTQFLEPYPVAGSQMGIAAAPMILWAFLAIGDGVSGLTTGLRDGLRTGSRSQSEDSKQGLLSDGLTDGLIGGLILVTLAGLSIALASHTRLPPAPTELKGAAWLHLPPQQTAVYESIVRSVEPNCSILFSMPNMGSFNLWSGLPTPNGWNLGAWVKGLSAERQAEILSILQADSRSCVIYSDAIVHFWNADVTEATMAALPLAHYIKSEMPKVAEFGGYELHVHPQRSSPWQAVGVVAQGR